MNIPKKCINCTHHKQSCANNNADYCDYIERFNGFAGAPVPYPYFYKQAYPCKGHQSKKEDVF